MRVHDRAGVNEDVHMGVCVYSRSALEAATTQFHTESHGTTRARGSTFAKQVRYDDTFAWAFLILEFRIIITWWRPTYTPEQS